jgi:hypothetical protein
MTRWTGQWLFHRWQDEDIEVDPLPTRVRLRLARAVSQQGQTQMIFVEYESTDDE